MGSAFLWDRNRGGLLCVAATALVGAGGRRISVRRRVLRRPASVGSLRHGDGRFTFYRRTGDPGEYNPWAVRRRGACIFWSRRSTRHGARDPRGRDPGGGIRRHSTVGGRRNRRGDERTKESGRPRRVTAGNLRKRIRPELRRGRDASADAAVPLWRAVALSGEIARATKFP